MAQTPVSQGAANGSAETPVVRRQTEQPAEQQAERPAEKLAVRLVEKLAEMQAGPMQPDEQPARQPAEKPAGASAAVAEAEPSDKPSEDGIELRPLYIIPPDAQPKYDLMVTPHEKIHEIRQSILDHPFSWNHTCFHLEHRGTVVDEFLALGEIPGADENEIEFKVVLDPYAEKDARMHFNRVRDLVGADGGRTESILGPLNGLSVIDDVAARVAEASGADSVRDYDFDLPATFSTILPVAREPAPKTLKAMSLSHWNPPPAFLKQRGHLLYLVVMTNDGEQMQITSHVGGFYVNKSTNAKFDPQPRPGPKGHSAHSLLSLLELASPSFPNTFAALQEYNSQKDPLSTFMMVHSLPVSPWVVPASVCAPSSHVADPTRAQEAYLSGGFDNSDSLRDWNEEIQSTKEQSKDTFSDKLFRDRLTSKLYADYVESAVRGAVLVARGEVLPLNPTECPNAQIFIYNNVFYSFGADGSGTFTSEGGDEAARVATGKDVAGVRFVNQLDIDGLYTSATVVVDYLGKRVVGQSIVPGIFKQREPGENQIDYGAADGKGVVTVDERFVPEFRKMSQALKVKKHAVWDKDGKRFDLETSVETKGLMGTDGRKYALDLYRITPPDIAWQDDCAAGEESDQGAWKYPHRMSTLRPELVESYVRHKLVESRAESQKLQDSCGAEIKCQAADPAKETPAAAKDSTSVPLRSGEASEPQNGPEKAPRPPLVPVTAFNPDVFSGQVPQTDEEKKEMQRDEAEVRQVCAYLRDEVIPCMLRELIESDIGFPMDGTSLTRLLHKRGINVRYVGKIASTCKGNKLLDCLRLVCVQEMITRGFKHVASAYLRALPAPMAVSCVSHLLNCLLGTGFNPKPDADVDPSLRQVYSQVDLSFEKVTPESLRKSIETQVSQRFRFTLEPDWHRNLKPLQVLRQVCMQLGIQIQARDYAFEAPKTPDISAVDAPATAAAPATTTSNESSNGESKKKKKKNRDESPAAGSPVVATPPCTFRPDDVVYFVPIVKHSCPRSSLAEEALETARMTLAHHQVKLGRDLLLESLSLHEQIYGILHPEVSRVYNSLSIQYSHLGEKDMALELARKAIIVSERTLGVDSAETLLNYLNLSLLLHQAGESKAAIEYSKHALQLWKIIYGPGHPDTVTVINNAAVMLQSLRAYRKSRVWFDEALRVCEDIYGKQSVNAASLLFQLSQAVALEGDDFKDAVRRMKEAYSIFLSELGPNDRNTKESEHWLEQLTQKAVRVAIQEKDQQARRLSASIRPAAGNAPPGTAKNGTGGAHMPSPTPKIDPRNIDELIKYIEGADGHAGSSTRRRTARGAPKRRV